MRCERPAPIRRPRQASPAIDEARLVLTLNLAARRVRCRADGAVLDRLLWFDSEGHKHFPKIEGDG
jgi:hypothetical protein